MRKLLLSILLFTSLLRAQPVNHFDRYSSTLSGSYTSGGTSMSVASATGLPTGAVLFYMIVKAESGNTEEVIKVTSVSGTTLTMAGAQSGTSASNHGSGAVIIGPIDNADTWNRSTAELNLLSETRPPGVAGTSMVKNVSVAHGATQTLLSLSATTSGYVDHIWIGITCTDSAALTNSNMTITADSATVFNDRFPLFFGAEYLWNTVNFSNRFIGGTQNQGGWLVDGTNKNLGVYSYIPIPFDSSISIAWTNAAASASATIWYTVSYQTGIRDLWSRTRHLVVASGTVGTGTLGVDTVATLLNASSLAKGRLLGVYMSIDAGAGGNPSPRTAGLEGKVKIYVDGAGTAQYQSSGTEDYFEESSYFEGHSQNMASTNGAAQANYSSWDKGYSGVQFFNLGSISSPSFATLGAYRFHILDPIYFANALKVTWDAGYSSVVNYTGTYRLAYAVWYYTE